MQMNISITKSTSSNLSKVDFDNLPFGRIFSDHMFVCDYADGSWQQPRIIPFQNFDMHPASMVLHYGQAIFEGMKASKSLDGRPMFFRPELHAERLNISARRICMPEFPEELFLDAIHQLVGLDSAWIPPKEGSALYIRPTMVATDEFIGVKPSSRYRFFIFTCPVGPYYSKPVRLWADTHYIRAAEGGTGFAKYAGNYGATLLPAQLAMEKGYDQIMWLDAKEFKYIQECGTMNIMFVIDGKVLTPPLYDTILDGVTRKSALEILRSEGYEVEEKRITIGEVVTAYENGTLQEAFGVGTAAVVSHASAIGYKDLVMELPPASEQKVGAFIKATIDGLRSGKVEDKWGWVVPVGQEAAVAV
ncbi:MAG TPA: branched-chain amino acid aminotransferase [Bacteroidetes bacterium]|nr:branched-chain amino acid aminotransferase [Bacteroidota bacterium]